MNLAVVPLLDQVKEPGDGLGISCIVLSNGEAGSEKDGRAALMFLNRAEEGESGTGELPWRSRW